MLTFLKSDILLKDKLAVGLELILNPEKGNRFNIAVLERKKGSVAIKKIKTGIQDIAELKEYLPKGSPVSIVMNGKGVLHKKAIISESDNEKSILQKILAGANPTDFYMQKVQSFDNHYFISVIRKDLMDKWLETLKSDSLSIIGCSFGPFVANILGPLLKDSLSSDRSTIQTENFKLFFTDHHIEEYQFAETYPTEGLVQIGEEQLEPASVLCFATAFAELTRNQDNVRAEVPAVETEKEEYNQKIKFRLRSSAITVFFVVVLLVNFFFNSYYSGQRIELGRKLQSGKGVIEKLAKLKQQMEEKQAFLEKNGLLQISRNSWYADQLVLDMPETIQLTKMDFNPLVKKRNEDENKISFDVNHLLIEGTCKKSIELNEWLKIIKKKNWIAAVSLLNYSQDKSKEAGEFSLSINVN